MTSANKALRTPLPKQPYEGLEKAQNASHRGSQKGAIGGFASLFCRGEKTSLVDDMDGGRPEGVPPQGWANHSRYLRDRLWPVVDSFCSSASLRACQRSLSFGVHVVRNA